MADRYWVGGSGTWNSTNTANWSSTSGGSGGASVPTAGDNVYFDDSSYAADLLVVTVSGNVACGEFRNIRTGTKVLKIVASSADSVSVWGNAVATGGAGRADFTAAMCNFIMECPSTSDSDSVFLSGANPLNYIKVPHNKRARIAFTEGSGTISKLTTGDFSYVRFAITTRVLSIKQERQSPSVISTSQLHVGTFVSSSTAKLYLDGNGLVLDGSFVVSTNSVDSYPILTGLIGDSEVAIPYGSLNKLVITPSVSSRVFTLSGAGVSITTIERSPASLAFTLAVRPSADISITNFNITGESSVTIGVRSTTDGVRAKLTKLGGGLVETNYMEVKDMQPYPDNTWISYNSTNAGNNWQWYFDTFNKPTSCLFFGSHV